MEGAATELQGWGVTIAKVDGTREKELSDQFGVSVWPTLKMFRKVGGEYLNHRSAILNIVRAGPLSTMALVRRQT